MRINLIIVDRQSNGGRLMAHDVFLSYSDSDRSTALAVLFALEHGKIRCWMAPRDVLAGMEYGTAILEAIKSCRVMILIFSGKADSSPFVRREVERAVAMEKIIMPFRIENILPSRAMEFCLGNTHWLDALTPPLEKHIGTLVNSVERVLVSPSEASRASAVPNQDRKLSRTEVIHADRVFRIEQISFSADMPWPSASNALCAFAEAPQDPSRYKILDLQNNVWIPEPAVVGDLKAESIALVAKEFISKIGDDPAAVSAMLQMLRGV
jgi:hypothetical protein